MADSLIQPHIVSLLPFVALLAAIALAPLFFADWWGKHYPKICFGLGGDRGCLLLFRPSGRAERASKGAGICQLHRAGRLVVRGFGRHPHRVKGEATPFVNVLFLAVGALLANVLGTTGASMLLIRPWIRMNKYRVTGHHISFFIFIISNVGGCLTPVGDPPLFLGYLIGVPFWWVAQHGWPIWLTGVGILLAMFYAWMPATTVARPKPVREHQTEHEQWRFDGLLNLLFLAVIFAAVFVDHPPFLRELLMVGAALGSYFTTETRA